MGFFYYHWHRIIAIKTIMMKNIFTTLILVTACYFTSFAQNAKVVSDCTISYTVTVEDTKANAAVAKLMAGATKTVYIKGSKSRSDLETPTFKQSTFYDIKSDSTVILREVGNTKYISYLTENKRIEKNRKYNGIEFSNTTEKKTILGYECNKVVAKLADGSTYDVYYTPAIITSNPQYEYQFKDLPGLVLEYESSTEDGKSKVNYSATKITLIPVAGAKFDLPVSGYRVL
ncbi:MAG TPA: hypothetical protein VF623_10490 [Segetibacter sp.]